MSEYLIHVIKLGAVLFFFLLAIGGYEILFLIAKRTIAKGTWLWALISKMKKPTLVLLLEFATLSSISLFSIPEAFLPLVHHLLVVLIIATIGVALIIGIQGVASFLYSKYMEMAEEDLSKRSLVTQIQILRHLVVVILIVLTVSSILLTFPGIRALGIGLLGSAGILGLIVGMAAKPILLNLLVGFHIAFTKKIKIGDTVIIEGELARVEYLFLTHVILKCSDGRRLYLPISYFVDKPFQNWSHPGEIIATATIFCDYTAPLSRIREKFQQILQESELWNRQHSKMEVSQSTFDGIEIKFTMGTRNSLDTLFFGNQIREKMVEFLQKELPGSLPCRRYEEKKA